MGGRSAAPQEVLVAFRPGMAGAANAVATLADADRWHSVGAVSTNLFVLHSRSKQVPALLTLLSANPNVRFVQPNFIYQASNLPNDSYYSQLWGMQKISAPSAWDVSTGAIKFVASAVDTGIDYTHPDLVPNIWSAPTQFSVTVGGVTITCPSGSHGFNAINNTCDPRDDHGHGTHVSGTIAAAGNNGMGVAGVNWSALLIGAKMMDSTGSGTTEQAVNAIEFLIQAKLAFANTAAPLNIRVLSASWGDNGVDQAIADEISRAGGYDMLFVAAAGNAGVNTDASPFYPASAPLPNIISVAATESTDNLTSWSNYGPNTVNLAAPGDAILSTYYGGGYATMSGTSMATPHVSGSALLLLAACPDLDTPKLKAAILNKVDVLSSLTGKVSTGGRLNVSASIHSCLNPGDFSIAISPSSVSAFSGSTATFNVSISPVNGFSGTVSLTASGLPANATGSFNPPSVTLAGQAVPSTLTISTTPSTPVGPYTVLVSASSGSMSHSASATLNVNPAPDYTVSVTPTTLSAPVGSGGTYRVTLSPMNGFTGAVSLSTSGLPSSIASSFSSPTLSLNGTAATSSLTLSSNASTSPMLYNFNVNASSGAVLHTAAAGLNVTDFAVVASPMSQSVTAGSNAAYTVTLSPINNFSGTVALSTSGLPSGVSVSFNPSSLSLTGAASSSTMSLSTTSVLAAGSYPFTILGSATGGLTHSSGATLVVSAPAALAAVPGNVSTHANSASSISVSWSDGENPTGFYIERCAGTNCSKFSQVAAVAGTLRSFTDNGLVASTSYSYRLRAYNTAGVSAYSNIDTTRTKPK